MATSVSAVVATVAAAVIALQLGAAERGGVPHWSLLVDGRMPATLYIPGHLPPGLLGGLPDPAPVGARPPLVVLVHGHSADQNLMSGLAREIAAGGYAALTVDLPGHGANREPFQVAGLAGWRRDLGAVLDWARSSPHVDPDRVILLGHSLGAAAVLDAASHDPRPAATVAIGGGPPGLEAGVRARNALFLLAASDSPVVRAGADRAAQAWSGDAVNPGQVSGDHAEGSAVAIDEVPGTDHLTILFSDRTPRAVLDWVQRSVGPGTVAGPEDRRPALAAWYAALLVPVVPLLALGYGRLATRGGGTEPALRRGASARALAVVTAAALLALPWISWGGIGAFVGLEVGGALIVLFAATGTLLLLATRSAGLWRRAAGPDAPVPHPPGNLGVVALTAAAALAGFVLLLLPLTPLLHTPVPTPQRVMIAVLAAGLILPFTLGLDVWLRRGSPVGSAVRSLLGRLLVLAVTLAGVLLGLMPGMLLLYLVALVPFLVLLELGCLGLYTASRDRLLTALVQAGALGWLLALLSPVLW